MSAREHHGGGGFAEKAPDPLVMVRVVSFRQPVTKSSGSSSGASSSSHWAQPTRELLQNPVAVLEPRETASTSSRTPSMSVAAI